MPELRLRVQGHYDATDLAARFDEGTTVGQLADAFERATDTDRGQARTIRRLSRGQADLVRESPLIACDLRSGDEVQLAIDSGVRGRVPEHTGARLRIVGGPHDGETPTFESGEYSIGRSSRCDLSLEGELVSRHHATLRVTDTIEVVDAGSRNGVVVNGERITGLRQLRVGDQVEFGDAAIVITGIPGGHGAIDVAENAVRFNRPPRIDERFKPTKVALPAPVAPVAKPRIPLISALVPVLMGVVFYLATRNVLTIMFLAMSPLLILGNFVETKRKSRQDQIAAKAEYDATMHDRRIQLRELREQEIRARHHFAPDTPALLAIVEELSPRLWEREPRDGDFLQFRLGLAPATSDIEINIPQGGTRDQQREMQELAEEFAELPPVPVTVECGGAAPVGLAGPRPIVRSLLRQWLLQAAAMHAPSELLIAGVFARGELGEWDWLKWLPHCADGSAIGLRELLCGDGTGGTEWAVSLQHLVQERMTDRGEHAERAAALPRVLVLVDNSVEMDRGRFSALLELGAAVGVHVLWVTEDARRVPNACRAVVSVEPGGESLTLADGVGERKIGGVPIESLDIDGAEGFARRLAPVLEVSANSHATADLPTAVNLVSLFGGADVLDNPERLCSVWAASKTSKSIAALVGAYEGGALSVDLRIDGPHGLVGGTTGSGKSEFLQSYLSALAMQHSPERVNFLLVDYKGGSAFGDLVDRHDYDGKLIWRGLPHAVGMITDLTPAMVQRALVSLQAEVHRREVILNRHRAKDLVELESRGAPDTPANLLIVVDEFAALAKEVPAFVDGVVDIAQRGRSLGLHLLLATQKPGGVITPSIQANTNLRVALRMATEDESRDVINAPVAGRIDRSTPGRAVMRRGPTDLVTFQSAYVGGRTEPKRTAQLELGELQLDGITWFNTAHTDDGLTDGQESDLRRIVRLANTAAQQAELPPAARPWLDPLPSVVNLLDLPRGSDDTVIPFGLSDLPHEQSRDLACFRPDDDGSLLVFGMGGSGKTVFLRTLAVSAGLLRSREPCHVYCLDFAGRGLNLLEPLPHVGEIIGPDDYDRTTRLLSQLSEAIERRAKAFAAAKAASLSEFRARQPSDAPPRLLVLLDGFDAFTATYEKLDRGKWIDLLPRLVADGRSVGVHFVLTGTRRLSFPTALASQVSSRVVLRMATDDEFHAVGVEPRNFDEASPPGRALLGSTAVQVGLCGGSPATAAEARTIQDLVPALSEAFAPAAPIRVLPSEFLRRDLPDPEVGLRWVLGEHFRPWGPTLDRNLIIAGPPHGGKTSALASLVEALADHEVYPEVYAHSPSPLLPTAQSFEHLFERLESDDTGLIVVDDADRLSGSPADVKLQAAIADGRLRVVFAADAGKARGFDALFKSMRARADVCVIQPSAATDDELLGAPIPKSAAVYPPGRALMRIGETVKLCQIGLPSPQPAN